MNMEEVAIEDVTDKNEDEYIPPEQSVHDDRKEGEYNKNDNIDEI